jgi:SAM-dependent methyltransferase
MNVFADYANYYELLYQDKNYDEETKFIQTILLTYVPQAQLLLDLGCGTGKHATLLAEQGYNVHGVDRSIKMLQQAEKNILQTSPKVAHSLKFTQGDIQQIRLNQKFDAILALFHVVSYQIDNISLIATFATVKEHLNPGSIFIFDVWYGPAVLNDQPTVRVKRVENEQVKITRIAEPVLFPNENMVDVNYLFFIEDKEKNISEQLNENHRMRYIFKSEIEFLAQKFDLKVIECREWMSDREPSLNTWGVYFVITN